MGRRGGDSSDAPSRVLLVEDDAADAFLVQELLRAYSSEFAVTWVRDLGAGIDVLTDDIDCVLLDLGLPDTEELEGLRTLLERQPHLAVVVLTGFGDRSSGEQALAHGAQDYLAKGAVDEESLARALRYAVARRRGEEASRQLREAELLGAENSRLERGLLPRLMLRTPRLAWATRYEPGGRRALLGGDFFDCIELEDGSVRAVIGDVCGHGPDEAALGVALRVAWRAMVLAHQPAGATLTGLERMLEAERTDPEVFASVCDIEIDAGLERARLCLAGHPAPLVYRDGAVMDGSDHNHHAVLGALGVEHWQASEIDLGRAWTMVAFTDGIVEGRLGDGDDRLGADGLAKALEEAVAGGARLGDVADRLVAGAEEANGEPLRDDVALLLLSTEERWRG